MTTAVASQLEPNQGESEQWPSRDLHVADANRQKPDIHSLDATQGRQIGSRPHDDATQGAQIGAYAHDDATRAR